jgi:hypothetical protein
MQIIIMLKSSIPSKAQMASVPDLSGAPGDLPLHIFHISTTSLADIRAHPAGTAA